MQKKYRNLTKDRRKKILLLCDDIRTHSGIATMAREIVVGTAHHFNWVNLGASAGTHPDQGKFFDISEVVNKEAGIENSSVKLIPNSGYGDPEKIRVLLQNEKPDAIFIFTDPRYWVWLFDIEREIRNKIPIIYLTIWDNYPIPIYNKPYYNSCDILMCISKQTKNIVEMVLGQDKKNKVITYTPHGINEKYFYPIDENHKEFDILMQFRKKVFQEKDIEFCVFYNSRNITRKATINVLLAYRMFCDKIGKEAARKCALVMHTNPQDNMGTDLYAVREAFCDPSYVNVIFSPGVLQIAQMNLLYNIVDVTMLLSSNEGWGLSLTESMMAGTMILANVTGGMQDQMRFEVGGKWIDFTDKFPSNHRGTVRKCGDWAVPTFPSSIMPVGSLSTPYIYDDRCSAEDAAEKLLEIYNLPKEVRREKGLKGREWAMSSESGFSAKNMCTKIIDACDRGIQNFQPRNTYDLLKVEKLKSNYIEHPLYGY